MIEWSRPYAGWAYVAIVLGLVGLILAARRYAISDRLRRWTLFLPRVLVFSLLTVVLMNPVRRLEHRLPPKPAQVHFLVDCSRSMALEEPLSRSAMARQAIQAANQSLGSRERPRVQLFRFGDQLASVTDLIQLEPRDQSTRLAEALEQLPSRFARTLPRAVVLFSDGNIDDANRMADAVAAFRRLNVPIHVYPIGNASVRGDVAIDELVIPPRVDPGIKVPVRGVVRSTGYDGERAVVRIRAVDRPNLPPLVQLPVTLDSRAQPFEIVVQADPEYGELLLEVEPLPGEVTVQNNRVPFQIAKASRKLKVIYMEGTGGTEYRWVRDALQEDKDIECLAMVADQQYVQRPRLVRVDDSVRGFPTTREELLQYDCVICSDISLGAFTREQLDWTVELVAKHGGGFAMVGGITSFGAGHWDQTVWDQLIPINMAGGTLGQGWLYHQFTASVPNEAQSHPIWRIVEDPEQNRRVLAAMPPFLGTNYMQRLKPAATVLAVSATPIPPVGIMPIMAAQPYGRGRTFALAPDTTADWGRLFESQWGEQDNRYFRRYWRNVVRWLTENSIRGNKRLQVETDRVIYREGQRVVLTARAFDEKLQETVDYDLAADVAPLGKTTPGQTADRTTTPGKTTPGQSLTSLTLAPNDTGKSYSGEWDATMTNHSIELNGTGAGVADSGVASTREITVVARHQGKEISRSSTKIQILPDVHELLTPRPNHEFLTRLAESANGTVLRGTQDLASLLERVPTVSGDAIVSRQPLWDRPLIWATILVLLAVEWSLRRWSGYG